MVLGCVEPKCDALCQFMYFLFLEVDVSNISKLETSLSRPVMFSECNCECFYVWKTRSGAFDSNEDD